MFTIPPQFRGQRTPGQVPSREGLAALKLAQTPAPSPKLTASRLLEHTEPRLTARSIVKGLGLDAAAEQSWVKFLGETCATAQNEVVVRKALSDKFREERLDPSLRNVIFQRSMNYYRGRMQKSGSLAEGQPCVVVTVDELRKAKLMQGERLEDEGGKVKGDADAKRARTQQNKADRELAKKRKREAAGDELSFAEMNELPDTEKSKDTAPSVPVMDKPEPATNSATRNPGMQAPGRANSASRLKIQTHVSYRAKQGAPIAGLNKSRQGEVMSFYLSDPEARASMIGKRLAKLAERRPDLYPLAKAEPKGGMYHKRITDKKSGKHKYFYDPAKYASSPDAHVDGAEALKQHIHKCISDRLDKSGECTIEDFKDLAQKHGPDKVGDALREGCATKKFEYKGGKFRKCMGGANAVETGK